MKKKDEMEGEERSEEAAKKEGTGYVSMGDRNKGRKRRARRQRKEERGKKRRKRGGDVTTRRRSVACVCM